jgi:hypothetical protein
MILPMKLTLSQALENGVLADFAVPFEIKAFGGVVTTHASVPRG